MGRLWMKTNFSPTVDDFMLSWWHCPDWPLQARVVLEPSQPRKRRAYSRQSRTLHRRSMQKYIGNLVMTDAMDAEIIWYFPEGEPIQLFITDTIRHLPKPMISGTK